MHVEMQKIELRKELILNFSSVTLSKVQLVIIIRVNNKLMLKCIFAIICIHACNLKYLRTKNVPLNDL